MTYQSWTRYKACILRPVMQQHICGSRMTFALCAVVLLQPLQRKGVSGYMLDLRDNPGGLVKSGLDIARMLLDGHPTVFSIVGREGEAAQRVSTCGRHVRQCCCAVLSPFSRCSPGAV
jgi:hypothetical protein